LWILADAQIELIAKTVKTKLQTTDNLRTLLEASEDWVNEWSVQMGEIRSFAF